jgi:UTP--glucose-1-phosphate uridylyltransferase
VTNKIKKAVFPVAGLGTRFLPATKSMPKEMLTVIDRPLIQYAVEEAKASGIEEFIFVTGRGKTAIEDFFDYSYELNHTLEKRGNIEDLERVNDVILDPGKVIYTRQQEPMGLGHAIWCARHLIKDEPFAVLLADDMILSKKPCLKQMIESYSDGNMAAVMQVPYNQTNKYGILDCLDENDKTIKAKGLVEKPDPAVAPSNYAIIGRYILTPEIFDVLDKKQSGAGGEVQLTDAMQNLIETIPFYGYKFEGKRFDCGNRRGFLEASINFALERADIRENVKDIILKISKELKD